MGKTDSAQSKRDAESSNLEFPHKWPIRAIFGTNNQRNATHGSDSKYSAMIELEFFFPGFFFPTMHVLKTEIFFVGGG